MTLTTKKQRERFFVEETAKRLGKTWILGADCEHPDFLVTEGTHQFGLEVTEIFTGPENGTGSAMKIRESHTQRAVGGLRKEYERITNVTLRAQFVGDMGAQNMAKVVPALLAHDLGVKSIGHHVVIDDGQGLRVHVTKALRPDWFSVNDRVGWQDRNPMKRITEAVIKKSARIEDYRNTAGPDIRLLLVADRIYNSGKLILVDRI